MDNSTPATPSSLSQQAARLSWTCPVLIFILLIFSQRIGGRVIIELLSLLLIMTGLVFGVLALFGLRAQGASGILAQAAAGIILNGLLAFIFVTNFTSARAQAQKNRGLSSLVTQTAPGNSPDAASHLYQYIVQSRRNFIVDTNQAEIAWSDGVILEIGTSFPDGLQDLISHPTHYQNIRSFLTELDIKSTQWQEASVTPSPLGDNYAAIRTTDGKIRVSAQSIYVEYLNQQYPAATILVRGESEPIVYVEDGEIRASLMPVKL